MRSESVRISAAQRLRMLLGATLLTSMAVSGLAQSTVKLPKGTLTVSDFVRVADAAQVDQNCLGPGTKVAGGVVINNSSGAPINVQATVTLAAGFVAVPGTCVTVGGGTCMIVDSSTITYSNAALAAGQSASFNYVFQVGDTVPSGTQICVNVTAMIDSGAPVTVQNCLTTTCQPVGPGILPAGLLPPSDQKAGSVLIYNLYSSSAASPASQNTRFNITNIDPDRGVAVHLFFVDGSTCSVSDRYICLTPSQTMSFLASEQDPGTTGFLIAIATDTRLGCPINFNQLMGDAFVKLTTGHQANLGAEAISALAGGLPFCNENSVTALVRFDGLSYGYIGRVLATSSIPSRADGNDTLLAFNRIGGDLMTANAILSFLFGILYDDAEQSHSFQVVGGCQLRFTANNVIPRTTPRFETVIPAGQSGWLKVYSPVDIGILGVQINLNPNSSLAAGAFGHGRNLHKLKLTSSASYIIPVFPPGC